MIDRAKHAFAHGLLSLSRLSEMAGAQLYRLTVFLSVAAVRLSRTVSTERLGELERKRMERVAMR